MTPLHALAINVSDVNGGAARAAYRIHHSLRRRGVDSKMLVNSATAGDWTVEGPQKKITKISSKIRGPIGALLTKSLKTSNPIVHSPAIVYSRWSKRINNSNADIIHLHWVNNEMMSISDIGNIEKPIIWTLHDMWAFCGAEHYTDDFRWRDGYNQGNRPDYENGFDLNKWTWERKCNNWKRPIQIITPSQWLAECAKKSILMQHWPINVIPNAIDTDKWQPIEKSLARQLLNLPPNVPLLLFGAMGGTRDPRKGFDLLQAALGHLCGQLPGLELVVFGQLPPKIAVDMGFPVHYTGHLHDDITLQLLYSATDAMVIPSKQDNLPNTGIEAHSCGTPVIAFNVCGLPDIIEHKQTGYLAKAFDTFDLAFGIQWILSDAARLTLLRKNARKRAVNLWSYETIGNQYSSMYHKLKNGI
jgi:glycosyltransferase involved in cell wall biosynthesis